MDKHGNLIYVWITKGKTYKHKLWTQVLQKEYFFLLSQFHEVCWGKNSSWMLAIKRLIGSYWLVAVYIKADVRVTQSYPKNDKYLVNSLAELGQPPQASSVKTVPPLWFYRCYNSEIIWSDCSPGKCPDIDSIDGINW